MTQLEEALKGNITKEMEKVARYENMCPEILRRKIKEGFAIIPSNVKQKNVKICGIGEDLKIKVNANIGTSPIKHDLKTELKKLKVAIKAGADTVMDLSTGWDIDYIREEIVNHSTVPVGTVPIYQAAIEVEGSENLSIDSYLKVLEKHAKGGIDFATIHAGVTKKALPLLEKRLLGVVSRGGAFMVNWMRKHNKESFLYEHFDEILNILKEYDVAISLGDGLRPGCINDATDKAQIYELIVLGKLAQRCKEKGVQVMIEGPGHIPLEQIEKNVILEKKYCNNAPFYVLGPLPTDIATGYDHVACAIGGALAAWKGADFLCYVTPKEHIGLPNIKDVREGVIVSRIAAHIADIARGKKEAKEIDNKMSKARSNLDWNEMARYAIDPEEFIKLRKEECKINPKNLEHCSMCGEFCAIKTYKKK